MIGEGNYDHWATLVRDSTGATAVVVAVIEGTRGNGFSVQATPEIAEKIPSILRKMADMLENDQRTPPLVKKEGGG